MNKISCPGVSISAYCRESYMSDFHLVVWYTSLLSLYVVYELGVTFSLEVDKGSNTPETDDQAAGFETAVHLHQE